MISHLILKRENEGISFRNKANMSSEVIVVMSADSSTWTSSSLLESESEAAPREAEAFLTWVFFPEPLPSPNSKLCG